MGEGEKGRFIKRGREKNEVEDSDWFVNAQNYPFV